MTTIRYFIPEDGDEETHPNVFLAPKPRQPGTPPTLGQVKFAFPLPGTYHFRFKSPLFPGADRDKGAMAVWMDTTNDQMPVPTWKNSIVAKVTRVNIEDEDDDDDDADFGHHHAAPPVAPPAPVRAPAPVSHQNSMHSTHSTASSADHLDLFDGPSPTGGGGSVHSGTNSAASGNLFDHAHHQPAAPSPAAASDLLGMDYGGGHQQQHQQHQQHQHNDFLGMTAPAHTPPAQPQPGYGAPYGSTPQQRPPQQQQQQQQQQQPSNPQQQQQQQQNSFNSFSAQKGPFGGLGTPWK